jgi:hypothetical protein
MTCAWTTSTELARRVRRRWDDGTLLSALAAGDPFPGLDLPVRGPHPSEIGDDLAAVQRWVAELEAGSRNGRSYELVHATIGGRHFGRNRIPARARVTTYEQAWQLLGVAAHVAAYRRILDLSASVPAVRSWAAACPLRALDVADEWEPLVAAYSWLDAARGSGRYLREITAPGVDTKFVERHRSVLSHLLGTVRLRFDPAVLGMPAALTEAELRVEELAALPAAVRTAAIIENETTYLTVPVPSSGVVMWGKGFEVSRAGALPWLRDADVYYWGDLDTHGFAILDRLRAWLPCSESFLMDRGTLLAHRDRWVREGSPTSASLDRLNPDEAALYRDLVADQLGDGVRLEQERIDWAWASKRIPYE